MTTTNTEQTIGQWLEGLAISNSNTEQDDKRMANILHRLNFPAAIVTCGIVYLEGKGTIDAPPAAIQTIAQMLVNKAKRQ